MKVLSKKYLENYVKFYKLVNENIRIGNNNKRQSDAIINPTNNLYKQICEKLRSSFSSKTWKVKSINLYTFPVCNYRENYTHKISFNENGNYLYYKILYDTLQGELQADKNVITVAPNNFQLLLKFYKNLALINLVNNKNEIKTIALNFVLTTPYYNKYGINYVCPHNLGGELFYELRLSNIANCLNNEDKCNFAFLDFITFKIACDIIEEKCRVKNFHIVDIKPIFTNYNKITYKFKLYNEKYNFTIFFLIRFDDYDKVICKLSYNNRNALRKNKKLAENLEELKNRLLNCYIPRLYKMLYSDNVFFDSNIGGKYYRFEELVKVCYEKEKSNFANNILCYSLQEILDFSKSLKETYVYTYEDGKLIGNLIVEER